MPSLLRSGAIASLLVTISQIRTVPSNELEATVSPSGEYVAEVATLSWPVSVIDSCPPGRSIPYVAVREMMPAQSGKKV